MPRTSRNVTSINTVKKNWNTLKSKVLVTMMWYKRLKVKGKHLTTECISFMDSFVDHSFGHLILYRPKGNQERPIQDRGTNDGNRGIKV